MWLLMMMLGYFSLFLSYFLRIRQLIIVIILFVAASKAFAGSGGPLSPEQAAYDVNYYDLSLAIDPTAKTINGSLVCRVELIDPIDTLVLDLENTFTIDSTLFKTAGGEYSKVAFSHIDGKVNISIPVLVSASDLITVQIFYGGTPRVASNPPWGVGFVWEKTQSGGPWIGVACEGGGADIWWPCKDHPSDEPDSMSMSFTVPNPLICVSNGRFLGSTDNDDNTTSFNWFISTPINNYNVSIYVAEYSLIEDTYQSVSGDEIPFYFWVLPEDSTTADDHMDVFLKEFNFLESICGPFPFATDKHGWAHAPYWGMEHQTIIAYGHDFTVNRWGMDYIHYHELAHEWWGNLITAKDWADLWIHEGLATYMEALYVEHLSGLDKYHQYMNNRRPSDNQTHPLAPCESITAAQAFDDLNSYYRGASVMHTLRYHLGDEAFFNLLKRWAYPDSTDFDNTNGRLCQIVTTDDMKEQAEVITARDLDPFFEVFFRETAYPVLHVVRGVTEATFTWVSDANVPLDVNIPIQVNGEDQTVEMTDGQGIATVSEFSDLMIDPDKWILMAEPVSTNALEDVVQINNYQLNQNYPNPFNPMTTIHFSIPESQFVTLTLFDLLGKEIRILTGKEYPAGNHKVIFDGSKLTSGTYLYRLRAGDYSEAKRFILLK